MIILFDRIHDLYTSMSLSSLILIELGVFVICLHWCLPQRHRQARTIRLSASPQHIWRIIFDTGNYSIWRSHVVSVSDLRQDEDGGLQFLEHVARTRQHLEHKQQQRQQQQQHKQQATSFSQQQQQASPAPLFNTRVRAITMKRMSSDVIVRQDRARTTKKKQQETSFEREWEICVRAESRAESTVTLTETVKSKGYLARWLGPILGFHRVSHRFLVDLAREVERQQKQRITTTVLCDSPADLKQQHQDEWDTISEIYVKAPALASTVS
ncbi:hypothetical protein BCR43DRAFT_492541 [Syncephalastrum racemosum]|uniref:Uncharacterized protein n=1 Tax=Syncephalastrum racemosum TaxID=13706 RepID=A0A1X2HDS6_SYNRA|nr:hypothetical protein BCR43DRAFT_492541 [Syncephalastrum racemosum]